MRVLDIGCKMYEIVVKEEMVGWTRDETLKLSVSSFRLAGRGRKALTSTVQYSGVSPSTPVEKDDEAIGC
jgi:hypothetical protein